MATEQELLSRLDNAQSVEDIETIKQQLDTIAVQKWEQNDDYNLLNSSIRAAYNAGTLSQKQFEAWTAATDSGNTDAMFDLGNQLMTVADTMSYHAKTDQKSQALTEEAEKAASSPSTVTTADGVATIPANTNVSRLVVNPDGTAYLEAGSSTVATVKAGAVTANAGTEGLTQDVEFLDKRPMWTDLNYEAHRIKTDEGYVVDSTYMKRYYSVIDAEIFFGNEFVEDIADINWQIGQNVMPLFGYNSYTYDEVARGNRLIVGNFTINFTSPNYLFQILKEANTSNTVLVTNMTSYDVPVLGEEDEPIVNTALIYEQEKGHHSPMWPETFDIDVIFGEKTGAGNPVHIIIKGVALKGCQMALSGSAAGVPPSVMEQYTFIAQDIRTVVVGDNGASTTADKTVTTVQSGTS